MNSYAEFTVIVEGKSSVNLNAVALELENQKANGDIILDSPSTLTMKLEDGSAYTGAVNSTNSAKKADVTLETGSRWTLTGDSYVSSLSGDTGGIDLNGNALYVGGVNGIPIQKRTARISIPPS